MDDPPFTEHHRYEPNSPYSASKAGSDHLVRAYHQTYGLRTLLTNCSNNYGPFQFPEELIPLVIVNALSGKPVPIYGDGMQVRDWLYVGDHCTAVHGNRQCRVDAKVADAQLTSVRSATAYHSSRSRNPLPLQWTCANSPTPRAQCAHRATQADRAAPDSTDAHRSVPRFLPDASRCPYRPIRFSAP